MRHEAKSFRIGNFIQVNSTQKITQIDAIDIHGNIKVLDMVNKCVLQLPLHELSPIPIREYWLLKMGWRYYQGCTSGTMTKDAWTPRLELDYVDSKMQIKSRYGGEETYYPLPHIQHVHDLQNLYYFLTGEELVLLFGKNEI